MTATEVLAAAVTALRTDTTPLHAALADWLDDTHRDMTERIHAWERAYNPDHARETHGEERDTALRLSPRCRADRG
jgi:hypothetical protein